MQTLRALVRLALYVVTAGARRVVWLLNLIERDYGHRRSVQENLCVDRNGAPIPWYTYPAIEYLRQLDTRDKTVFEYGLGYSSLFWADKCRRVVSVDNNRAWHETVRRLKRDHQTIFLAETETDYVQTLFRDNARYDILIVDGDYRLACAKAALERLAPGGFVILDNSDWYPKTAQYLREAGLIQIDFTGLGPINYYTWCTSLFLSREVSLKPLGDRQPVFAIGGLEQTVAGE